MEKILPLNSKIFSKFLSSINNINYTINKNFFKENKFENNILEEKYKEISFDFLLAFIICADIFFVINSILLIIFTQENEFFSMKITNSIVLLISFIFIFVSYRKDLRKHWMLIRTIGFFLYILTIFIFCGVVCFCFEPKYKEKHKEYLFLMISFFQLANQIQSFINRSKLFYGVYLIFGNVLLIVSYFYSGKPVLLLTEIPRNFLISILNFCFFNKVDYLLRINFTKDFDYENLYSYSYPFNSGFKYQKYFLKNSDIIGYEDIEQNSLIRKGNIEINNNSILPLNLNPDNRFKNLNKKEAKSKSDFLRRMVLYNNATLEPYNVINLFENDENYYDILKSTHQNNLNLKDFLIKTTLDNKINERNDEIIWNLKEFQKLGIYLYNEMDNDDKYYDIFLRHLTSKNGCLYFDLVLFDISDLVLEMKKNKNNHDKENENILNLCQINQRIKDNNLSLQNNFIQENIQINQSNYSINNQTIKKDANFEGSLIKEIENKLKEYNENCYKEKESIDIESENQKINESEVIKKDSLKFDSFINLNLFSAKIFVFYNNKLISESLVNVMNKINQENELDFEIKQIFGGLEKINEIINNENEQKIKKCFIVDEKIEDKEGVKLKDSESFLSEISKNEMVNMIVLIDGKPPEFDFLSNVININFMRKPISGNKIMRVFEEIKYIDY